MLIFWIIAAIIVLLGFTVFFGAPYVPSHRRDIVKAFDDLYHLKKSDVLLDLGAGDGIVLRIASPHVKRAVGYELSPIFGSIGKFLSRKYDNVELVIANMWTRKFPDDTTVLYVFCNSRDMKRLLKKIQKEANRLDRTLTVISYGFEFQGVEVVARNGVHHHYEIKPMHA